MWSKSTEQNFLKWKYSSKSNIQNSDLQYLSQCTHVTFHHWTRWISIWCLYSKYDTTTKGKKLLAFSWRKKRLETARSTKLTDSKFGNCATSWQFGLISDKKQLPWLWPTGSDQRQQNLLPKNSKAINTLNFSFFPSAQKPKRKINTWWSCAVWCFFLFRVLFLMLGAVARQLKLQTEKYLHSKIWAKWPSQCMAFTWACCFFWKASHSGS